MRSTIRQSVGQNAQARSVPVGWGRRFVFGLRVVLAASTVVVTSGLLAQETAKPETRWLLAFLATSLFIVSVVETRALRPPRETVAGRVREESGDSQDRGVVSAPSVREQLLDRENARLRESYGDEADKVRQLRLHRTDYVPTISHELRTPLTSIRGFAQLLKRGEVAPSVVSTYATTILDEADRLARIVDDIVDLTKMESAILELRKGSIDTVDLMDSLVERLGQAHSREKLTVSVDKALPRLRGDRDVLGKALERLLLGAISHASPDSEMELSAEAREGEVTLQLRYEVLPLRINRVQRAIKDLWQCGNDGVATRLGRGDVGLYVAKNLVEAHGGRISVESMDEREARITITLPC